MAFDNDDRQTRPRTLSNAVSRCLLLVTVFGFPLLRPGGPATELVAAAAGTGTRAAQGLFRISPRLAHHRRASCIWATFFYPVLSPSLWLASCGWGCLLPTILMALGGIGCITGTAKTESRRLPASACPSWRAGHLPTDWKGFGEALGDEGHRQLCARTLSKLVVWTRDFDIEEALQLQSPRGRGEPIMLFTSLLERELWRCCWSGPGIDQVIASLAEVVLVVTNGQKVPIGLHCRPRAAPTQRRGHLDLVQRACS